MFGHPKFMRHENGKLIILPRPGDVVNAIALEVDVQNTLSQAGTKILSLKNETEKFWIDKDGNVSAASLYIDNTQILRYDPINHLITLGDTTDLTGTSSLAIGDHALINGSTTENFALGYSAGQNETAGYCVYLGNYAGADNAGASSVFIGNFTGWGNTQNSVIFIGRSAGMSNTGHTTVGIGSYAGLENTGYSNCFIGYEVGRYNTGSACVGLGAGSLYYNKGHYVVSLGLYSGQYNRLDYEVFIDYKKTQLPWLGGNFYDKEVRTNADLIILNDAALGSEVLSETDFTTHANWNVTGDFDDTIGAARYTHSTGSGSLTQSSTNFANPIVGNRWYRLEFDVVVNGTVDNFLASVSGICSSRKLPNLKRTNTYNTLIYTLPSPGDFVISATSTGGTGYVEIDNISLKEIQSGDGHIRGNLTIYEDLTLVGSTFSAANLKSGVDQASAGATAGEVWVDTSANNVLKLGV